MIVAGGYLWLQRFSATTSFDFTHFGGAFFGSLLLLLAAWLASRAPSDIVEEMFGIGQLPCIFLSLAAVIVWMLGAFCDLVPNVTMSKLTFGSFFFGLFIYLPSLIIGFICALLAPFLIGAAVVGLLPYAVLGVVAIATTAQSLEAAKDHLKNPLPSDEIERRLAEAMARDTASDEEVINLIYQLPLWSRIKYTFIYKVKQKKYFEIWQLLKAQEEMLRERTKTARAAHEYERAKRGDH